MPCMSPEHAGTLPKRKAVLSHPKCLGPRDVGLSGLGIRVYLGFGGYGLGFGV